MYIPEAFRSDPTTLYRLMRDYGFATLVSVDAGEPHVTHLPLLLECSDDGTEAQLVGHVARANPHWQALVDAPDALAIFHGPHGYVSPAWYGIKKSVPTWNYTAVHAWGKVELIHEPVALEALLRQLVDHHEAYREVPWRMDLPHDYMQSMIAGIVGMRIRISRLEGKLKLSQNRPRADRENVVREVRLRNGPDDAALAAMMEEAMNR